MKYEREKEVYYITFKDITEEELTKSGQSKVMSTSATEVLEECMRNNQNVSREVEGRLIYK